MPTPYVRAARPRATALALAVAAFAVATPATAQDTSHHAPAESLGAVRFDVSCAPAVRPGFDRAVALLHHMTYPQARTAFEEIAERDPGCAMAHWGIAMTLFQPLWPTRPGPAELRRGRAAVERALGLGAPTDRERRYIAAAEAFFGAEEADYWTRIRRWAQATTAVHRAHPGDRDAAAFHALALLAVAPATGGTENHREAAAILGELLVEAPSHPGAVHYTIHANDAPGRERESLEVVRSYGRIAPRNPHALHMPSHIFVRLGSWDEVVDWNVRAAEAALAHPAGDRGQWVWDEFPHAVEYLVYAHLQRGDDAAAAAAARRLQGTADLQPTFKTAFHLASIPARIALEGDDPAAAAALPLRDPPSLEWDRFPWPEAITRFARALGAARGGDVEAARQDLAAMPALAERAEAAGEELFARQIEILRLGAAAWVARAAGEDEEAVALLRRAAALEASTPKSPVTPAPTLPADELLGDLLLELGRPAEALDAYDASLRAWPGRHRGLRGAARAAVALGDSDRAAAYYRRLLENAAAGSDRPGVAEARRYLSTR